MCRNPGVAGARGCQHECHPVLVPQERMQDLSIPLSSPWLSAHRLNSGAGDHSWKEIRTQQRSQCSAPRVRRSSVLRRLQPKSDKNLLVLSCWFSVPGKQSAWALKDLINAITFGLFLLLQSFTHIDPLKT